MCCMQVTGEGARMGLKSGLTPLAKPHTWCVHQRKEPLYSLSTQGGYSFSFICPEGHPFPQCVCLQEGLCQICTTVCYMSRVAVPVTNLCSLCALSLNTQCLGVCCRSPSPQVGLGDVAFLCRDPRGIACPPLSKLDPDSGPAAAGAARGGLLQQAWSPRARQGGSSRWPCPP